MFTKGEWFIRTNDTEYPDLKTYTILYNNPDAGKSGVCFSGDYLSITTLDSYADAQHIVEMHNKWDAFEAMREALNNLVDRGLITDDNDHYQEVLDALSLARGESKGE